MESLCKYYPSPNETPVCGGGAEIGSLYKCTRKYSLSCPWAEKEEERRRERKEATTDALQHRV